MPPTSITLVIEDGHGQQEQHQVSGPGGAIRGCRGQARPPIRRVEDLGQQEQE